MPACGSAARKRVLATPPLRGRDISMAELIKEAKKEGQVNAIATPPEWANYGEVDSTFRKKYGMKLTVDNPEGSSAAGDPGDHLPEGQSRGSGRRRRRAGFAVSGTNQGLYEKYYTTNFKTVPRAMKDGRGYWAGDYYGAVAFGTNTNIVKTPPTDWSDLLTANYKVALNDDPRSRECRVLRRVRSSARERRLAKRHHARDRLLRQAREGGQVPADQRHAADRRLGPDAGDARLGLQPARLQEDVHGLRISGSVSIPKSGVYGGYYCQAINADAPHPWAARLWQEFLYSDQGQLLFLKGFAHPARFADLVDAEGDPEGAAGGAAAARALCGGEVREPRAADEGQGDRGCAVGTEGPRGLATWHGRSRRRPPAGPCEARPAASPARLARRRPVLRLRDASCCFPPAVVLVGRVQEPERATSRPRTSPRSSTPRSTSTPSGRASRSAWSPRCSAGCSAADGVRRHPARDARAVMRPG